MRSCAGYGLRATGWSYAGNRQQATGNGQTRFRTTRVQDAVPLLLLAVARSLLAVASATSTAHGAQ